MLLGVLSSFVRGNEFCLFSEILSSQSEAGSTEFDLPEGRPMCDH